MAISFDSIPSDLVVPLFYAEFSGVAPAAPGALVKPTVLLGQMLAAGTATAGVRTRVTSVSNAAALFGRGSSLHRAAKRFFAQHPTGELYAIPLADDGGGTAASATITVTASSAEAGTIYLRIGDTLIEVDVAANAAQNDIAADIEAAIDAEEDLMVTASVNTNAVTVTCRHKGTIGNQIPITVNALGQAGGETTPSGVTVTLSAGLLASGATDPSAASWVTGMADDDYDQVVPLLGNTTVLAALKTEMARRWGPTVGLGGHVFAAVLDSQADLETFVAARNDQHLSILGLRESSPHTWLTPAFEVAAAYAGVAALRLGNDPGAPLQFKPLVGVWGGIPFTATERNQLAISGCGTLTSQAGQAVIESEVTTYTEDENGEPDAAWQYTQNPYLLQRLQRRMKSRIVSRYPDFKLGDDSNAFAAGQRVVTPSVIKAELVAEYADLVSEALFEDVDAFKESIVVERNASNRNRLDVLIRPDLINQFRVAAMRVEYQV